MAKQDCKFNIPIKNWSTIDYEHLAANKLGFLSDDSKQYLFFTEKKKKIFENYLNKKS